MFDKLFGGKKSGAREALSLETATAALLVEAAREDQAYTDEERRFIERFLSARFTMSAEEAATLRERAEEIQAAANDIQRFTRIAKDADATDKRALIEALWRIALSDGKKSPYEEALVRRVCGLIYVDDRESGEIRIDVEKSLGLR